MRKGRRNSEGRRKQKTGRTGTREKDGGIRKDNAEQNKQDGPGREKHSGIGKCSTKQKRNKVQNKNNPFCRRQYRDVILYLVTETRFFYCASDRQTKSYQEDDPPEFATF